MSLKLELEQAIGALLVAQQELQDVIDTAATPGDVSDLELEGYATRIQACRDGVMLTGQILRRLGHNPPAPVVEEPESIEPDEEVEVEEDPPRVEPANANVQQFDMEKVPPILRKEAEAFAKDGHGTPQDFLFQRLQDLDNSMFMKVGYRSDSGHIKLNLSDTTRQAQVLRSALYDVAQRQVEVPR